MTDFYAYFLRFCTNGGVRINGWLLIGFFLKLDSTKSFVLMLEDIKSLWIFHLYFLFWISMYRSFLTLKVLNVRKRSVVWHSSSRKCDFHLLNYFLCVIQTYYEKVQKRICFWIRKTTFWSEFWYSENHEQNMHDHLFFAHFHVDEDSSTSSHG
jgi:hypothetical protein